MQPTLARSAYQQELEDPLAYLPLSDTGRYFGGQKIYSADQSPAGLYLVIEGKVKLSRITEGGREIVIDIYQPDDFFGESVLLNPYHRSEEVTALDDVKVMLWPSVELPDLLLHRPRLAFALLQTFIQRSNDFKRRIESFTVDKAPDRLASALIHLSERSGTAQDDGSVRMVAYTHALLSHYVGTTREVVTQYMNQFRRLGYLSYSRKDITVHRDALREWISRRSTGAATLTYRQTQKVAWGMPAGANNSGGRTNNA